MACVVPVACVEPSAKPERPVGPVMLLPMAASLALWLAAWLWLEAPIALPVPVRPVPVPVPVPVPEGWPEALEESDWLALVLNTAEQAARHAT